MHTQVVSKGFGEKICLEVLWEGLQDGIMLRSPLVLRFLTMGVSTAKGTSSKSNSHWDAIGNGENRYKIKRQNKQNPHKTRNWENEVEYHIPRDCCLLHLGTEGTEKWVSSTCQAPHKGRSAETRIHRSRPSSEIGRWAWGSQQRH